MNRIRAFSNTVGKSSNYYDGTYYTLLKDTLREELVKDTTSTKLVNDSTRAWLQSTWYRNPIKNVNMEKNVLSVQGVASHLETLRRKRDFKNVFYTLNLIKNVKAEWITNSDKKLYKDESGVPEEFYFVFNKTMMSIISGYLHPSDVLAIARLNLKILKKYVQDVNREKPSISFLIRTMGLICKARSIFLLNEGLSVIFANCKSLQKEEVDMIKHLSLLRFFQETDQRSKLRRYYKKYCHKATFLPLFVVGFNFERLIEHFIISKNERSACMVLKKHSDLGFKLRPENISAFAAIVEKYSLKQVNKTLLELYPEEYSALNNTLCLNDVSNSDIEVLLQTLELVKYPTNSNWLNLDFMLPKIPHFEYGVEYYLLLEKLISSQDNYELKLLLINLFVKKVSGLSPSCFYFFLRELFDRDEMLSMFVRSSELDDTKINLRSLIYLASSSNSSKIVMFSIFTFLAKHNVLSKLTAFDYSIALQCALQSNNRDDFFYYLYHFMMNHGPKYISKGACANGFKFPTNIQDILDHVRERFDYDINSVVKSLGNSISLVGQADLEIAKKVRDAFGSLYVDQLTSEQLIKKEKETKLSLNNRETIHYNLKHDLKHYEQFLSLQTRLELYMNKR